MAPERGADGVKVLRDLPLLEVARGLRGRNCELLAPMPRRVQWHIVRHPHKCSPDLPEEPLQGRGGRVERGAGDGEAPEGEEAAEEREEADMDVVSQEAEELVHKERLRGVVRAVLLEHR